MPAQRLSPPNTEFLPASRLRRKLPHLKADRDILLFTGDSGFHVSPDELARLYRISILPPCHERTLLAWGIRETPVHTYHTDFRTRRVSVRLIKTGQEERRKSLECVRCGRKKYVPRHAWVRGCDFVCERCTEQERKFRSRRPLHRWESEKSPVARGLAKVVEPTTRFPDAAYLKYLVREMGYLGSCASACIVKAHLPWMHIEDRRDGFGGAITSPDHPYVPMSPSRRTHVGGGMTKEQVSRALSDMRQDGNMQCALLEVVFRRQSPKRVAAEREIPLATLKVYASRLRKRVREANAVTPENERCA